MPPAARQHAEAVGLCAGTLSLTEIGLGSLMHGLHIPLTGTILSLNQGLFLSRVIRINKGSPGAKTIAFEISTVTALLKSFSPVGKRLTPMLAIATQGLLFTLGPLILGVNIFGVIMGSILLATWSIIQPAILAGIMFHALSGSEQDKITTAWLKMTSEIAFFSSIDIYKLIAMLLFTKCAIGASLAIIAWYSSVNDPSSFWRKWEHFICRLITMKPHNAPILEREKTESFFQSVYQALKVMKSPMIGLSIGILMGLSYFIESQWVPAIWVGLRALAGIFIFYVVLRIIPWHRVFNSHDKHGTAILTAISVINSPSENPKQVINE